MGTLTRKTLFIFCLLSARAALGAGEPLPDEEFCAKAAAGNLPRIEFKYFDRQFRFDELEASRQSLVTKCAHWNSHRQDNNSIAELARARDNYAGLSLQLQDKMLSHAIGILGPARNQLGPGGVAKDTRMCAFVAAADAISYRAGRRVSAFSLAVRTYQIMHGAQPGNSPQSFRYHQSFSASSFEAALRHPLEAALAKPVCPEDQPRGAIAYDATHLAGLYDAYEGELRKKNVATEGLHHRIWKNLRTIHPKFQHTDFLNKLQGSLPPLNQALADWYDRQGCNIKASGTVKKGGRLPSWDPTAEMDRALDAKTIPLVAHDSRMFRSGTPNWITFPFHVSTVLAKITLDKKEFYLYRGTYGPGVCQYLPDNLRPRCRMGHVWLTKEELHKISFYVSYYE